MQWLSMSAVLNDTGLQKMAMCMQTMSEAIRSIDPGTINLGLCDFCPTQNKILRWDVVSAASIHTLFAAMDERPFVGRVVIERQSKKSMKMLSIMHFLQAYYVLKGNPVVIFAPRHKLAGSGQENTGRSNYRARKKAAISITRDWLRDNPQAADIHGFFETSKKKDDASDCLLQALAFLRRPMASQAAPVASKIVCRRPTLLQERTGRYTPSNIKFFVIKRWQCADLMSVRESVTSDARVAKAIRKHFGTIEQCWERLTSST